jgi:hypothetical protein
MKNNLNAIIFAIAMVISSIVLGGAWANGRKPAQKISVTGSASVDFTSDLIVWKASFSKNAMNIKEAYSALRLDEENIRKYLLTKGVNEKEIVFSAVNINKIFRNEVKGKDQNISIQVFDGYSLTQHLTIESRETDKIEKVSREVTGLIEQNIELYSEEPQYYYTKLSELKITMLSKATADGRLRAQKIAENAGSSLGELKGADMGIFQITGQNSSEGFSSGGAYNTANKHKTASITTHLEFGI